MKYIYSLLLSLLATGIAYSQQQYNELRYRQRIFNSSTTQNDVQYGSSPQWVWPYWNEDLNLNVYQPSGDNISNRPLVILAHSGGFINGSKDVDDMVALCDSLARLGYVTASIEYRKGFNPLDAQSAERAVYRGIQDGKAAVRYFKANAAQYGIDTNYIYFGGMSAGGYISLHVAYMDQESERPASTYGGGTVNDLGCLDCAGGNYSHNSKVRAILDYWGAVQDTTLIIPGDVPLMIMHGENDPTVPFNYDHPFGLSTLPETYGGNPIHQRALNTGLDVEFYTSQGPLHMLDGSDNGDFTSSNPPNDFWFDTLLPKTREFLYRITKPNPLKISQDTLILCYGDPGEFLVDGYDSSYYKWTYAASSSDLVVDNHNEHLTFLFGNPGSFDIAVVEFNEVFCASDTLWFHVVQQPELIASFSYNISNLQDVAFSGNGDVQHWNFGDGTSISAINPTHTYNNSGSYTVQLIVEDIAGCSDTTYQTVDILIPLGVDENSLLSEITIYPNPFNEQLSIQNESAAQISVIVTAVNGKIVQEELLIEAGQTMEIESTSWNSGMYFVTVSTESGEQSIYKVIK